MAELLVRMAGNLCIDLTTVVILYQFYSSALSSVDPDPELLKCVGVGFRSVQVGKRQVNNLPRLPRAQETVSSWKSLAPVVVVRPLLISVAVASAHRGSPEAEFMNVQYH